MEDLGPVLSKHDGRIAAGGYFWWVGGLALVFGAYRVVTGAVGGDFVLAGQGVTGMAFGAVLWVWPAYLRFQTLTAHQNGFVWKRILRAPVVVRWADVTGVQMRTEHNRRALHMKGTNVELDISLRSGGHVVVSNDLDGIEQIQGYLQRGAAAPPAQAGAWGAAPAASPWGAPGGAPPGGAPPGGAPPSQGGPPSPWGS